MSHSSAFSTGQDEPPGITAFSFLPPRMPPPTSSIICSREAQRQLVNAGLVHVAGEAEQPGAAVLRRAERREGRAAVANDGRNRAEGLDVVQHRRALERARDGRKRRPDARDAALAFERIEQRRFLAALVGARAGVRVEVEIEAGAVNVLAQIALRVGFGDGAVHDLDQVAILAANVDVAGVRIDRQAGDQHAFDQLVRIVLHQQAVLAGARLALVAR